MLGIDWIKILIHFIVFAVLAVGLYLLLYKPVLRFIRNRQETIQKGIDEGKNRQEEGNERKAEYDRKLAAIETERTQILSDANAQKQVILDQAQQEAQRQSALIKQSAEAEAQAAKDRALREIQEDAGKLALDVASQVLRREITPAENERLIKDCLSAWSDHE